MSLYAAAAQARAAVERARALFGPAPRTPPPAAGVPLDAAVGSVTGSGERAAAISGALAARQQDFVRHAARALTANAHTDDALDRHLGAAATTTEAGGQRLDAVVADTRAIAQSAATARTPAAQRAVLRALYTQVSEANSIVSATQQRAVGIAGQIRALKYPAHGGIHAVGFGGEMSTDRPPQPPHGRDPRYWIDVTRIIHVPDGQMAPYNTKQIGPGLWYPFDDGGLQSGPPAARYPLDVSTITKLNPGAMGPYGTTELAPGIFAPDPRRTFSPDPLWPVPRLPIDVRDVIHVPDGGLAPPNYVEYVPGWWAPEPPRSAR